MKQYKKEQLGNFKNFYEQNCWKGYRKQGTKKKGDKRVNNCVKIKESSEHAQLDLGHELDAIQDLLGLLDEYGLVKDKHYKLHVGYGDDLPNAITIHSTAVEQLGDERMSELHATVEATHGEEDTWYEKNATCTGPTKKASSTSKGKKYMKCVKDGDGYKRIHWGQKGAKASSGNSKRKKAFRARHKCSTAKSNTPRGQACKDW